MGVRRVLCAAVSQGMKKLSPEWADKQHNDGT